MAKKKKHKNDVKTDLPIIMDYGIGGISVYDPADIMPYNEPPISEQIRFKKLGKEMKSKFKWLVSSVVIEYWQENRQIPFVTKRLNPVYISDNQNLTISMVMI